MKLDEIMNRPLKFRVTDQDGEIYSAEFTAGGREIEFYAQNESAAYGQDDDGEWLIQFSETQADGETSFGKTGSGNEFDVFATLRAIIEDFIDRCDPRMISFSADKDKKNNRARVYAKLFQKSLPKGWHLEKDETPVAHEPVFFSIVKEGAMKRSDPYISGEKAGPRPPDLRLAPAPTTAHKTKIEGLMKKSGKTRAQVEAAWNRAAREVPDGVAKWSKVMKRAKAELGVGE